MKGKIFATAIIAIFLVSMIPAVNADNYKTADYKLTYPDTWIDHDVQELTTSSLPVGEAAIGLCKTMTAEDDEFDGWIQLPDGSYKYVPEEDGTDIQSGIKGDLTPDEPEGDEIYEGSYIYYNDEKYWFHGLGQEEDALYYDENGKTGSFSEKTPGNYKGYIWNENNGVYSRHYFEASQSNIDEERWGTFIVKRVRLGEITIDKEIHIADETGGSISHVNDGYRITNPIHINPNLPEIYLYKIVGMTHHYRLFAELTINISSEQYDPTAGTIPYCDMSYRFYATGSEYTEVENWGSSVFAYSISEQPYVSTDLYDFTWIEPITKENFNPGQTIPVKFTTEDPRSGDFVHDETVKIEILNSTGTSVFSAVYGEGSKNIRIDDTEEHYIVNWKTEKTYTGDYTVIVSFDNGFITAGTVTI